MDIENGCVDITKKQCDPTVFTDLSCKVSGK